MKSKIRTDVGVNADVVGVGDVDESGRVLVPPDDDIDGAISGLPISGSGGACLQIVQSSLASVSR